MKKGAPFETVLQPQLGQICHRLLFCLDEFHEREKLDSWE